jgi:hypothetical protein
MELVRDPALAGGRVCGCGSVAAHVRLVEPVAPVHHPEGRVGRMADEWTIEVSGDKALRLPAEVPVGQILTVRRGEQTTVYRRVIEPVEPGSEETRHVWREVIPGSPDGSDGADWPANQEKG